MGYRDEVDLDRLFNPRSIVLIGASSDPTRATGRPLHNLARYGYPGRVYAVNPKYERIGDVPCYPSVLDLPEPVDLALICVPASSAASVLRQCAQKGVRAAVVNSSGFAEVGEVERQAELAEIAREGRIALNGPNCLGFVNFRGPVPGAFLVALDRDRELTPGPVGLVMQSGALGTFVLAQAQDLQIGLSIFVSTGNEAVLELADYVEYLLQDADTRAIGTYIEGLQDGRRLLRVAAHALEARKPIVVLRTGRTRAGTSVTRSHTALLAGSEAVFSAACRQAGMIQVDGIVELLDCSALLAEDRLPLGHRIGLLTGSGGGAAMLADHGEWLGLEFPNLAPSTVEGLKQILPPFATVNNPLDTTGRIFWEPEMYGRCLRLFADDPSVDVVFAYLGTGYRTADAWVRDLIAVRDTTSKPVVVAWTAGPEEAIAALRQAGIYVFDDPVRAIRAIKALVQYGETLKDRREGAVRLLGSALDNRVATTLPGPASQRVVSEIDARGVLETYGLPLARHVLARTPEEAGVAAKKIGLPVAMKVVSPDLPHKSEAGAVRLGIRSDADARAAFTTIIEAAQRYRPDATIDGVLVEEFVEDGVEVIVGAIDDPQFGPTVLFGLGGVFAEVLSDTALRIAPIDRHEALHMIREIKGFPLLQEARGRPPADIEALADVIAAVSRLAVDYAGSISELDLNPVIALPEGQGVRIVDVLMMRPPQTEIGSSPNTGVR